MVVIPGFGHLPGNALLALADDQGNMDAPVALGSGDSEVEVRHHRDLGELFRGALRCAVPGPTSLAPPPSQYS